MKLTVENEIIAPVVYKVPYRERYEGSTDMGSFVTLATMADKTADKTAFYPIRGNSTPFMGKNDLIHISDGAL